MTNIDIDIDIATSASVSAAPLRHIDAGDGIRYAYKRLGPRMGTPVLFLQRSGSELGDWDPRLIDAVAARHDVILFDNAGIGGSSGTTPDVVEAMAEDAVEFATALGLTRLDLFGYSLGGFLAQDIALAHPHLVRRLVLADTCSKGAPGMELRTSRPGEPEHSAAAAQRRAAAHWEVQNWAEVHRLTRISHPTLVLHADDSFVPVSAGYLLAALIPGSRIRTVVTARHDGIVRYADETVAFLGE